MAEAVKKATAGWHIRRRVHRLSGPGHERPSRPGAQEPGRGLGRASTTTRRSASPVRIVNDAAMQALGSYKGGRMLFLGLGTGLGSALSWPTACSSRWSSRTCPIARAEPTRTTSGLRGFKRLGRKKWQKHVERVDRAAQARPAGGLRDARRRQDEEAKSLPPGVRVGNNSHAILGGIRLWDTTVSGGHQPRDARGPRRGRPAARPSRRPPDARGVHSPLPRPPRRHPAHRRGPLLGRGRRRPVRRGALAGAAPGRAPRARADPRRLLQPARRARVETAQILAEPHQPRRRSSATACARSATAAGKGSPARRSRRASPTSTPPGRPTRSRSRREDGESGVAVLARALPVIREIVVAHAGRERARGLAQGDAAPAAVAACSASTRAATATGWTSRPACLNVVDFKDPVRARLMLFNDTRTTRTSRADASDNLSKWWDAPEARP